ncbi:hypothetical protein [Shewanella benthica]|uniref:Uncharacterized protein n=1 Tax=Shewanella benthica KT99 TaxID=314608 RepID=A9DA94_9GAMM|nr:hypothetical protein [Shewanella benthica]EDQ00727.1 hypothetical protein KT99_15907 [Shewanella benthica KT99]
MSSKGSVNNSQTKSQTSDFDTELAQIIPEMPDATRLKFATFLDSADNPLPEFKQQFIDSFQKFETLTQTDSQVRPLLPEGTTEETLAKELAKVDGSQSILKAEQQEAADIFNLMFESLSKLEPCDDIEEIRKLANAPTLAEAFPQEEEFDFSDLVDAMPQESAEIFHAAIACQLAGMTKPAKLLFKLFTQRQFIDANEGYQSLQTDITKYKGAIETAKHHSKKGENSHHASNRKRKEFAIGLFKEKPYKNPKQATERLFPSINDYANSINHPFTSEYQGFQTVYRWFLAERKNK